MGDNLPAVDLGAGKTAVQISGGGESNTCALLNDASVKCWGSNSLGQLGLGDTETRGDGPGEMGDNLLAIDLGTGKTVVQISANIGHACAVLNDASVKCWGYNEFGQLGLGDTEHRGYKPGQMGDDLPAVSLF
jgi:alpha-tubulin suppressor-like RCC1 family protein